MPIVAVRPGKAPMAMPPMVPMAIARTTGQANTRGRAVRKASNMFLDPDYCWKNSTGSGRLNRVTKTK